MVAPRPDPLLEGLLALASGARAGEPAVVRLPTADGRVLEIAVRFVPDGRPGTTPRTARRELAEAVKEILREAGPHVRLTRTAFLAALLGRGVEVSERTLSGVLALLTRQGELVNDHDHRGYGLPSG
jgi:hypothetical protein